MRVFYVKQLMVLILCTGLTSGCAGIGARVSGALGDASVAEEPASGQARVGRFVASSYRVVVEWRETPESKPIKVGCADISAIHPTTRVEVPGAAADDGSKVFSSRVPLELWASIDGGLRWTQIKWAPQPDDVIENAFTIVHPISAERFPCE